MTYTSVYQNIIIQEQGTRRGLYSDTVINEQSTLLRSVITAEHVLLLSRIIELAAFGLADIL